MKSKNFSSKKNKLLVLPQVGDIIYVNSDFYSTHGLDNKHGGKAKVIYVGKELKNGVIVECFPNTEYNWESLKPKQKKLQKRFGDTWAYRDPDVSSEINENYADYNLPELDPNEIKKQRKIN